MSYLDWLLLVVCSPKSFAVRLQGITTASASLPLSCRFVHCKCNIHAKVD